MPNYLWTFTCEETDEVSGNVNITTKTLHTDSVTFTDCLALLPQLIRGAGFRADEEDFCYRDISFLDWSYEQQKCRDKILDEILEGKGDVPGFRPYADPGMPVTSCVSASPSSYRGYCSTGNPVSGDEE